MAYPAHIAAALSGTSMSQLAYWRSATRGEALLVPELATGARVLYSFRDVVALRTVAFLREDVSLQKVRRAVSTLRELGNRDHLSAYRLVASDGSVVWVAEDDFIDLVRHPGQQVLAQMSDVLAPFVNSAGVEVPDFAHPRERLEVDADTLSGYPVITGTRVPFDLVASLVADGVPPERVADYYPGVDADAASQAADYAAYVDTLTHRTSA